MGANQRRTSIQRRGSSGPRLDGRWPLAAPVASAYRAARSGDEMEPYNQASVVRTCRGFVAHRGLRVPCQNSISGLPSLFSRPCCRPMGMPPPKAAVAVMEAAVMAAAGTAGGHTRGGPPGAPIVGGTIAWRVLPATLAAAVVG